MGKPPEWLVVGGCQPVGLVCLWVFSRSGGDIAASSRSGTVVVCLIHRVSVAHEVGVLADQLCGMNQRGLADAHQTC